MDRLNKGLFAFASHNAGPGRVRQLRAEAERTGLEPERGSITSNGPRPRGSAAKPSSTSATSTSTTSRINSLTPSSRRNQAAQAAEALRPRLFDQLSVLVHSCLLALARNRCPHSANFPARPRRRSSTTPRGEQILAGGGNPSFDGSPAPGRPVRDRPDVRFLTHRWSQLGLKRPGIRFIGRPPDRGRGTAFAVFLGRNLRRGSSVHQLGAIGLVGGLEEPW